ncbi:MAG: response regulator transcription factor [Candidatus Schekmanbacteria bacterium]|nr:response regulator transcription factor [Candidatus Schekmanbacteria bacterium]
MKNKILIIEDDEKLVRNIKEYLADEEFDISSAPNGEKGIELFRQISPELIILDLMMPKMGGLDVCREIRKTSSVPIIILTAKGDETDIVVGLEVGADDYLTKPFSMRELLARIKAALRRANRMNNADSKPEIIRFSSFSINIPKCEVIKDGKPIVLTLTEFNLLRLFCSNPGKVFTRDQLLDIVRGKELTPFDRAIDSHISHLRQKIENDHRHPSYIKTIWGIGYKFESEND